VPRFYFHLFNDIRSIDPEGIELPNAEAALERAKAEARHMAAQSVAKGHLILDHHIDVVDEAGGAVGTVYFKDVVEIKPSASS
jgi:hypothetical protein